MHHTQPDVTPASAWAYLLWRGRLRGMRRLKSAGPQRSGQRDKQLREKDLECNPVNSNAGILLSSCNEDLRVSERVTSFVVLLTFNFPAIGEKLGGALSNWPEKEKTYRTHQLPNGDHADTWVCTNMHSYMYIQTCIYKDTGYKASTRVL